MKNVKISFKTIISLLCILSVYTLPSIIEAKSQQPIYTPENMNTSDGFFNPQIGVCDTLDNGCENYSPGDCKYKFPTFVKSYLKWPNDDKTEPSICACQVFTCDDILAKALIGTLGGLVGAGAVLATTEVDYTDCTKDLGCKPIPLAPGPPPFCDQFETSPEVRIVPVAANDQSFFKPKIRVIIGPSVCDSNKTTCINNGKNLDINPDGSQSGNISIQHEEGDYIFRTYKEGDQLCAGFYGNKDKNNILVASRCFPPPQIKKPQLIPIKDQNGKIDLEKVNVKIPGYNNNPVTLVYGSQYNFNNLKLRLIKPEVSAKRDLEPIPICSNGASFSADDGCPEGQSIIISYKENSNGKVTCLAGWSSDQYVLKRGRIFKYLQSLGKQFNDYRVVEGQYIPCGKHPQDLNTMSQDALDTITPHDGSYYSISNQSSSCSDATLCCERNTKGEPKYSTVYKYEDVIHSKNFPSPPIAKYEDNEYPMHYDQIVLEGAIYYVLSTRYINENTKQDFFLTKDELENKDNKLLMIKDPYINNLCVENFERTDYIKPGDDYFYVIEKKKDDKGKESDEKKCQFVTMEAWGGGAAGCITSGSEANCMAPNSVVSVGADLSNSILGAAGDYVKATIKVDDKYPIFKIKIGSGGKEKGQSGNPSEVYMCDEEKKNCKRLIIAGGGGKTVSKQNNAIHNEELVYTRFIGRPKSTNEGDKIALPYQGKNNEEPHKKLYQELDDCKKLKKSNQVKAVENNNAIPGSGGCINKDKLTYQEGANGKVTITCEQWE